MDSIEKFIRQVSYKFPKGYPDMNNEQDIQLLNTLLEGLDINKQKKKEKPDYDSEILNLLTTLSDEEAKKKVIDYLNKVNKKEDKKEDKIEDNLEKELKSKGFNEEMTEYILLLSSKYEIEDELKDYLKSNQLLSLKDLGKKGNLYEIIKTKTNFPDGFIKRIINYTPSEGNKALGIGEIALALFFNAKKLEVGDIKIDGKTVEIKGTEARFPSKSGKGRSGDISDIYDELGKKYPNIVLKLKQSSLSNYIKLIAEQDPKILDFINDKLNIIYPKTDDIKVTLEDPNIDINKKYVASYVKSYPGNNYYMLMSRDSSDYNIYSGDELINAVEKGDVTFLGKVSKSNSYPQLDI